MKTLTSKKISEIKFQDLEIHIYSETYVNSNMYLIFSGKDAVVIDPINNDEVFNAIRDREISNFKIFLTHEHYDHISGVNYYKERWPCVVICSTGCAEALSSPRKNLSRYYNLVMQAYVSELPSFAANGSPISYSCSADIIFDKDFETVLGSHKIKALSVGGHSAGSSVILIDDMIIFPGDNLIPETNTVLTLPGGSLEQYERIVKPFFKSISNTYLVFPGHGAHETLEHILSNHPDYL